MSNSPAVTPGVLIKTSSIRSVLIDTFYTYRLVVIASLVMIYIVILLCHMSTIVATTRDTLEDMIAEVGEEKLSEGNNLKQLQNDPSDYLERKGNIGIVLEIENYSGLTLEDPEIHVYAGEQDKV